jgi:hypothetical protein
VVVGCVVRVKVKEPCWNALAFFFDTLDWSQGMWKMRTVEEKMCLITSLDCRILLLLKRLPLLWYNIGYWVSAQFLVKVGSLDEYRSECTASAIFVHYNLQVKLISCSRNHKTYPHVFCVSPFVKYLVIIYWTTYYR